jgi:hypothetical protein
VSTPALHAVPTLDEIARDPARAVDLSAELRRALIVSALTVIGFLSVAERPSQHVAGPGTAAPPEPDRLLTPADAAAVLGVTVPWLYRRAPTLPFARKLSRKCLRFSEAGLRRGQAARRP